MDELLLTPLGLWLLPAPGIPGAGGRRIETAPEATPQADPAFTSSLTSSVASLPFLGNWLVVASFVPNASTPASATAGYKVALRRQSNCSLDEDLILPGADDAGGRVHYFSHGRAGLSPRVIGADDHARRLCQWLQLSGARTASHRQCPSARKHFGWRSYKRRIGKQPGCMSRSPISRLIR